MEEEVRKNNYEGLDGGGDEERVLEWEAGLPSVGDLTPLSQPLVPPELASAFSITAEPFKSMLDVNRASHNTISSLRRQNSFFSSNHLKSLPSFTQDGSRDSIIVQGDEHDQGNAMKDGTEKRKFQRLESTEEGDSTLQMDDDQSTRALKRPRLVWTPQLHKRFVEAVAHVGINNAVPKTIMQMMNVEGLTRENVASHLQKYRQYLKRMQGFSNDGPSSSDQLFASTPVPQSLHESNGGGHMQPTPPMLYGMPMPVLGVPQGHGPIGMPVGSPAGAAFHGFQFHPYNMFKEQPRDWPGNMFGSTVQHPRVTPNDK